MKKYIEKVEVSNTMFNSNDRLIELLQIDNISEMELSEYVELLELLDARRERIYGLLYSIKS